MDKPGPVPCLTSVLNDEATFFWPRIKDCPSRAKAIEATPKRRPSITARPTINTVALPTHITLLAALLNILSAHSPLLSL
jgi:hypothetical protein